MEKTTVSALEAIQEEVRECKECIERGTPPEGHLLFEPNGNQRIVLITDSPNYMNYLNREDFKKSFCSYFPQKKEYDEWLGRKHTPIQNLIAYLFGKSLRNSGKRAEDFFNLVYWTHTFKCSPRLHRNFREVDGYYGLWGNPEVAKLKAEMRKRCKNLWLNKELLAFATDDNLKLIVITSFMSASALNLRECRWRISEPNKSMTPPWSNIPVAVLPNPSWRNKGRFSNNSDFVKKVQKRIERIFHKD